MDKTTLSRLFDFGPNGGLTGEELAKTFGSKRFILLLLDDTQQDMFLHRTVDSANWQGVVPARYWCARDQKSVEKLCGVLVEYSVADSSAAIKELMAQVLVQSAV